MHTNNTESRADTYVTPSSQDQAAQQHLQPQPQPQQPFFSPGFTGQGVPMGYHQPTQPDFQAHANFSAVGQPGLDKPQI